MATEQITYADEQAEMPNALEDSEIARLMKLVGDSAYKKSQDAPTRQKEPFKPRSLVEIAMEAQQRRDEEEKLAKTGSVKNKNINQELDINAQDKRTISDNSDGGSPISHGAVSQTRDMEPTDVAPPSASDKEIISREASQMPNTSGKNLDATETKEEGDVLHASTSSQNNKDENSKSEISHKEANETNQHTFTDTELPEAVENKSERYDEGFSAGLEAGRNEIREELEQELSEKQNTFESLITTLTRISSAETKELEANIQAAILSLASERAGIAILEMPENFITRIELLMSRLGSSLDSPIIKLNMADLKHIKAAKESSENLSNIRLIEDETLNHGDISISLGGIEIEDILENRTFIYPINADLGTDMEQPNSELNPDTLARPGTKDKQSLEESFSDNILENTTDLREAYKRPNQETEDEQQNIEDGDTIIDPSDGVA